MRISPSLIRLSHVFLSLITLVPSLLILLWLEDRKLIYSKTLKSNSFLTARPPRARGVEEDHRPLLLRSNCPLSSEPDKCVAVME
ncbi:hypothetical protein DPMN_181156 [Dreissena polymorpha]|uniref:Uncharacterized protein n=1 Tax=Dreissena polymorpha TaxID=45954 RepID=A0A9D4I1B7_DREPO|nr:hypothetical protein DPMN_181156 [Dreissena polymorpha]